MGLKSWFKPRVEDVSAKALYASAVEQARRPSFYTALGVADTREGRFELYSLHVGLLLRRLKDTGPYGAAASQALVDTFCSDLDNAMRELGVGDPSVPKRVRKLSMTFISRLKAYDQALVESSDLGPLESLIALVLFDGEANPHSRALAEYTARTAEALDGQVVDQLLAGEVIWPEVTP